MSSRLEGLLLPRLHGVRRQGGGWVARCPAHEDHNPSLSVGVGADGEPLIHCHAGCAAEGVLAAVGLAWADLYERERREVVGLGSRTEATYGYVDEDGTLLYEVVRYHPKGFKQRRPNGAGGWNWSVGDVRRVLYRLPSVLDAAVRGLPIYVAEGEKNVQALERAGVVATCNSGGAGKWRNEFAECLRGAAEVVVVCDSDSAGLAHGRQVMASLAGVAPTRLVTGCDGLDAHDHLAAGHTLADLVAVAGADAAEAERFALRIMSPAEICALPDPGDGDYLLGPLLRRGARTIIGGETGHGKTTFVVLMVAAFFKQQEFLGWQGAGGTVLVLDLEQGVRSVKRVLREAGLADVAAGFDYARIPDGLTLDTSTEQIDVIEAQLAATAYDVVVLDPFYKAHTGDSNAEQQVGDLMRLLDRWRARFNFGLVLPAHVRKQPASNGGSKFTIDDIFGSSVFVRGAEVVLGLRKQSDGYSRLYFFKDRDGDLPAGSTWGLHYDREAGYRKDSNEGVERDYREELLALAQDCEWRSLTEWRVKQKGGIGASKEKVLPALEALQADGLLEFQVGPEGRQRDAKCWRGTGGLGGVQATQATQATLVPPGAPAGVGGLGGPALYRGHQAGHPPTSTPARTAPVASGARPPTTLSAKEEADVERLAEVAQQTLAEAAATGGGTEGLDPDVDFRSEHEGGTAAGKEEA